MSGALLALRLERWALRAIQIIVQARSDPETGSTSADIDEFAAVLLSSVTTLLRAAAWDILPVHPFCTLPRAVLCNIWSHLTLIDTRAMASTSRDLACVVFCSPELWTNIAVPPRQTMLQTWDLDAYATYSVAEHLRVSLFCRADLLIQQFGILADAMNRIATLRLDLCDDWDIHTFASGSYAWSVLLEVLIEPAPLLTSLELRYVLGRSPDRCIRASTPISFDYPLFSGEAPHLRRCRLDSIVFPSLNLCGAFINVTNFSYRITRRESPSVIALILEAMPWLQVLELIGSHFEPHPTSGENRTAAPHPSLQVVMYSSDAPSLQMEELAPVLPISQLHEFWMSLPFADPYEDLSRTYPDTVGLRLGFGGAEDFVGCLDTGEDSSPARTVVFNVDAHWVQRLEGILTPFAHITWLAIDEHFWYNSVAGAPPPLPALTRLCVRLSPFCEYIERKREGASYAGFSEGILIFDLEDAPWVLPVLREVHLSAAMGADLVSLRDIARWIHYGIDFGPPGQKLDRLVLAGADIVDPDFAAAWNTLSSEVETILLAEQADTQFHVSNAALSYGTRAQSFFQELWRPTVRA